MFIRNNNRASTKPLDHRAIYVEPPFFSDQRHFPNKGAWGFFYNGPRILSTLQMSPLARRHRTGQEGLQGNRRAGLPLRRSL